MKERRASLIALAALLICSPPCADAVTRTWNGSSGNWLDAAKWGGTVPAAGEDALIPAGSVALTNALLRGEVLVGNPFPEATIHWGTTNGYENPSAWSNHIDVGIVSNWTFSGLATGLVANQTYLYRCYITNINGENGPTGWGGGYGGAGSGGGVYLTCSTIEGGGGITADGGNASGGNAGGGGGGRIAAWFLRDLYTGSASVTAGTGYQPSQVGTIVWKQKAFAGTIFIVR